MPQHDPIEGASSDHWEAGDDAICVRSEPWAGLPAGFGPQCGQVLKVLNVDPANAGDLLCPKGATSYLIFNEWLAEAWCACGFVKLGELTDDEKREFEADLRHDQRVPALTSYNGMRVTRVDRLDI